MRPIEQWPCLLWLICGTLGCRVPTGENGAGNYSTGQDSASSQTDDSAVTDDSGNSATPDGHSLRQVGEGLWVGLESPNTRDTLASSVNGYTYVLTEDGAEVRYLTDGFVAPTGDYCLGSNAADTDCKNGTEWTSGRLENNNTSNHLCIDEAGGRLFVISDDAAKVVIVDAAPEGPSAYTYNRAMEVIELSNKLQGATEYDGPCTYLDELEALVVTAPKLSRIALIDPDTGEPMVSATLSLAPQGIVELDSERRFVSIAENALTVLSSTDLSAIASHALEGMVVDFAVDPTNEVVWVLHDEGTSAIDLSHEGIIGRDFDLGFEASLVAADPSSGLGFYAGPNDEGGTVVALVSAEGVMDTLTLDQSVVRLVSAWASGDVVAIMKPETDSEDTASDEDGVPFVVLDAWPDDHSDRAPLHLFLASAIELPADPDIDMPCEGKDTESVERQINTIEANAEVLASTGIPVTIGITYNFATVVTRCGREDIFDTLIGHGFELGSMVHNRPCYECTDNDIDGTGADTCTGNDTDYCDPERDDDCCFPGSDEYCAKGDFDCYKAFVDEHNLVVDGALPDGGRFITSADRHGLWDWDWVRGYQEMARADGSEGYDVSFFAQSWAYSNEVSFLDPRGKDPAPWRPEERVVAWGLEYYKEWDQDSAYTDLLYLPGLAVSTVKLYEWHSSGLFLLDYFDYASGLRYEEEDFEVLHHYLRRSHSLRSDNGPNVFYQHIHDLSESNLAGPDGNETEGAEYLRQWVNEVQELYDETGSLEWTSPVSFRQQFPPNQSDTGGISHGKE